MINILLLQKFSYCYRFIFQFMFTLLMVFSCFELYDFSHNDI